MGTTEVFLIAMAIIFAVPYLAWRFGRTDYFAPLVVVQIVAGVVLGPGVLGKAFPDYYAFVFNHDVVTALNGVAWWAVMIFVWLAGIELDLRRTWRHRRESLLTAGLALGSPLACGCLVGAAMLTMPGWIGPRAQDWQFVAGIGMSCAVTALPILIMLMEKLDILRTPLGQRLLRYASLDDIAIWGVLALILMDWQRVGRQLGFLAAFGIAALLFRRLMRAIPPRDRWHAGLIWLIACSFGADWSGLHYMVGAFLAGAVTDAEVFGEEALDSARRNVLSILMPVFFLSTGLRTDWSVGGGAVFLAAAALLFAAVVGKLVGVRIAGYLLKWRKNEASVIGWLLQTKALIMIIFANVLLDKQLVSGETFTALLLMAVASTMMTTPMVAPRLRDDPALLQREA